MKQGHSDSREIILSRIRAGRHEAVSHPEMKNYRPAGNPADNFVRKLKSFDGNVRRFDCRGDAIAWLNGMIDKESNVVFSSLPDYQGTTSALEITDLHAANTVNICVGEGILGVGETGSVWVTDKSLGLAAAALFSTDLYLMLDARKIVAGINDAYDAINLGETQYGAFYTGPSATADIEAVHITGAQGEISLTVLLYG